MQESNQKIVNIIPVNANEYTGIRQGETKISEALTSIGIDDIEDSPVEFVILGIPEDIGPRANLGSRGADKAWDCFLHKFLNIQLNGFISAVKIGVLGAIDCSDLMEKSENKSVEYLRELCAIIDERVTSVVNKIVSAGKIPIVIGGGHNNAYGIIKGTSLAVQDSIAVVNCDPHADFRALEGRHSGNGFSYAQSEGYLNEYLVFGAHESYNSEHILNQQSPTFKMITFDDILSKGFRFSEALDASVQIMNNDKIGLELDLDCIANMPSSAVGPSGLSVNQARQFVIYFAKQKNCLYLHLPEGAPSSAENDHTIVGKTLAYLVSDFVKTIQKKNK